MDDLISRQAAIDEVSKYASIWMEYDGGMTQEEVAEAALKSAKRTMVHILEEMPSAEPERKTGKWIEVDDYYNRISGRCSICGWEALLYETDVVGMDFCPNCGADMRGEQE